jgi:hypothetical protein
MSDTGDIDERTECGVENSPPDFRPCNVGCNVGRTRIGGDYLGGDGYCLKQERTRQWGDRDDVLMKNNLSFYDQAHSTSGTASHNLFGYKIENKLECCLGVKNDNVSCAVCWCPANDKCAPDCRGKNASGMFRVLDPNDTKCMEWQRTNNTSNREFSTKLIETMRKEQCNPSDGNLAVLSEAYSDIKKSGCEKICKDGSCDANIKKYCDNLTDTDRLKNPLCACYQPESFYSTIISTLSEALEDITGLQLIGKHPRCAYKKCIESDYKPKDPQRRPECNLILLNKCIKNMDVRTDGSVINDRLMTDEANSCSFDNNSYKTPKTLPPITDTITSPTLNPRTPSSNTGGNPSSNQTNTSEQKTMTEEEKKVEVAKNIRANSETKELIEEEDKKKEEVAVAAKSKKTNKLLWNIIGPILIIILLGVLIYLIKSLFRGGGNAGGNVGRAGWGGGGEMALATAGANAFGQATPETQSVIVGLAGQSIQSGGVSTPPQPISYSPMSTINPKQFGSGVSNPLFAQARKENTNAQQAQRIEVSEQNKNNILQQSQQQIRTNGETEMNDNPFGFY